MLHPPYQHLVYVSSAVSLPGPDALADILRVSRENNLRDGLTGILLYSAGTYFQALEGPPESVERTYERIEQDPRHSGSDVLLREPKASRYFEVWEMAFYNLDDPDGSGPEGFSSALSRQGGRAIFPDDPQRVHTLLRAFRAVAARDLALR